MDSNTKTTKTHQVMAMTTGWGVPHHFQETSTKKVTCQPSDWPKFGIYDLWQLWPALKFDDLDGLQRNMRSCGSAKYQRVGYLEHSKHQETNGNYAFRAQNLGGACTFSMFSNHPSVALVPHLVWTEERRLAGRGGHAGGVVLVLSAGTQWSKISTRSPCKMVSDWLLMIQVKSLGICSNPWKKKVPKSSKIRISRNFCKPHFSDWHLRWRHHKSGWSSSTGRRTAGWTCGGSHGLNFELSLKLAQGQFQITEFLWVPFTLTYWGPYFSIAKVFFRYEPRKNRKLAKKAPKNMTKLISFLEVPIRVLPQNGWFMIKNNIEMDDLGVAPFMETPIDRICCCLLLGGRCQPDVGHALLEKVDTYHHLEAS